MMKKFVIWQQFLKVLLSYFSTHADIKTKSVIASFQNGCRVSLTVRYKNSFTIREISRLFKCSFLLTPLAPLYRIDSKSVMLGLKVYFMPGPQTTQTCSNTHCRACFKINPTETQVRPWIYLLTMMPYQETVFQ